MEMVTPRIQVLEDGSNYGKFVVEPLEQGFGYTIGNALRRVLLASIPGAAITSIKIDGVLHEFSTIRGVKEDTTEIILNLRQLFVKINGAVAYDSEPKVLTIDVHGPGEVTGADIQAPEDVEIANPEVHIASLSDETTRLQMEMTVEWGKGYVLPDKQDKVKQAIGVIPVGAVYAPIQKVMYSVDPTRVGHKTDYDRLMFEIYSNGTVRPSEALSEAAKIIDSQLRLFFDFAGTSRDAGIQFGASQTGAAAGPPDARIEELDFSVRTYNCLKKANVLTIRELAQLSEVDLINIRNFGKKSLNEVKDKLTSMGLNLAPANERGELRIPPEARGKSVTSMEDLEGDDGAYIDDDMSEE